MAAVSVHPLTKDPTAAWEALRATQTVTPLKLQLDTDSPVPENRVRFICMSDTHARTSDLPFNIPDGDVFIHGGDFTLCGYKNDVKKFNDFLGKLPHKHKIVIAGNHEIGFDPATMEFRSGLLGRNSLLSALTQARSSTISDQLNAATYLEDSSTIVMGIKIYGSPWQPKFHSGAFNLPRGKPCLDKWNLIPSDVDILITHTPPIGHGDLCITGVRAGCVELLTSVQQRIHPRFHVFGHIHEGYGMTTDGKTIFINASTCSVGYRPINRPIVFDFPLPPGKTKDSR